MQRPSKPPSLQDPPINSEDLASLPEETLLHSIRTRYAKDVIYTHIGASAVLSVNPNKTLASSSDAAVIAHCVYASDTSPEKGKRAAHLFDIGESCYRHMRNDKQDQSVIIK